MKLKKDFASALALITAVSSLSATAVCTAEASGADDNTVKIMSLGDSITDGYWTAGGYRKYLCNELWQAGYTNVDFVGPKGSDSATFNYNGETVSYDDNYAGYSGYAIQYMTGTETRQGILETIQEGDTIAKYDPDVVLLQIGTNDVLSNYNDGITDRLENLVNVILEDMTDPEDVVYVSTIPDIDVLTVYDWFWSYGSLYYSSSKDEFVGMIQNYIDTYNESIYNLVLKMQGEGKPVKFADINSVVDYKTDLYDGVHPNEQGYEKMGKYWSGVLDSYFKGDGNVAPKPVKPEVTTEKTTAATITTTTTTTQKAATTSTTTTATTSATTAETTTSVKFEPAVPDSGDDIHLTDFKIGETYDLTPYANSGVSSISFVFSGSMQYGISGCVALGNWSMQKDYNQNDIVDGVLTVELDKVYNDVVLHKWFGDAEISDVILHCGTKSTAATTTTTTATAKPTTTTTTSTTTPTTTTTPDENSAEKITLDDVKCGETYSLTNYNPDEIKEIVIKLKGDVGYGFGGKFVFGLWAEQMDYGAGELTDDNTIIFKVKSPQDSFTIYNYWGNMELENVTLVY